MTKVLARVHMGYAGRVLVINGVSHNVHLAAQEKDPSLANLLESDLEGDEEAFDASVKDYEDFLLQSTGVTHVIDPETFGDELEHPVEEYISQ